jgi:hypothetical protein
LLSEHTQRLLAGNDVGLEERQTVPLKGKRQTVALYAPMRVGEDALREAR